MIRLDVQYGVVEIIKEKEQDFNILWTLMTNKAPDLAELKQGIIVKHVFGRSCPIAKIV